MLKAGGGNAKFLDFMADYDLNEPNCKISTKYNTVAAQYWRDKVHNIANDLDIQSEKPTKEHGLV